MIPENTQDQIDALALLIQQQQNLLFEEPVIAGLVTEAKEAADLAVLAIEDFDYATARNAAVFALTNFIAGYRLVIEEAKTA
jgi:hypothetical protein